jgi:hypothetical protein
MKRHRLSIVVALLPSTVPALADPPGPEPLIPPESAPGFRHGCAAYRQYSPYVGARLSGRVAVPIPPN